MSSPVRLSGLTSGLDVDGLVSRMMQVERRPVNSLSARQDELNVRLRAWGDIRTRLTDLQGKLTALQSTALFGAIRASVGDGSLVAASVTGTPELRPYSVEVLALARNTVYEGQPADADRVTDPAAPLPWLVDTDFDIRNADGTLSNATPLRLQAGWSLNQVADYLNSLNLNLKATVLQKNPGDYRLVVQDTRTGASHHFSFAPVSGDGLDRLGLTAPGALLQQAANASIKVDGVSVSRETNAFPDVITGLSLTAQKVGGPTSVTAARDTEKVVTAVRGFVDAYNALVNTIRGHASYDGKSQRAGPLFGDAGVEGLLNGLRRQVTATVAGVPAAANSLAMIGVSTARVGDPDFQNGLLRVDDGKLRAQLAANADAIRDLFTRAGSGLANALRGYVDGYVGANGVLGEVTRNLDGQVSRLKSRIDYLNDVILPQKEKRLREKFTALDRALASLQSQSTWLGAQLGALRGQNR